MAAFHVQWRGGLLRYGHADYKVVICTSCSEQYVHNDEHCKRYQPDEIMGEQFV